MKRRTAIKGLSTIAIGISLFSSCSDNLNLEHNISEGIQLNKDQGLWIESISDAILPKEGLQQTTFETFPEFVSKMIPFEKSAEDQKTFVAGYNLCTEDIKKMFESNVTKVTSVQIIEYFDNVLNNNTEVKNDNPEVDQQRGDKLAFCKEIRSLSIRHLTSSKEYQEEVLEYQLVPGFYNACVPV